MTPEELDLHAELRRLDQTATRYNRKRVLRRVADLLDPAPRGVVVTLTPEEFDRVYAFVLQRREWARQHEQREPFYMTAGFGGDLVGHLAEFAVAKWLKVPYWKLGAWTKNPEDVFRRRFQGDVLPGVDVRATTDSAGGAGPHLRIHRGRDHKGIHILVKAARGPWPERGAKSLFFVLVGWTTFKDALRWPEAKDVRGNRTIRIPASELRPMRALPKTPRAIARLVKSADPVDRFLR